MCACVLTESEYLTPHATFTSSFISLNMLLTYHKPCSDISLEPDPFREVLADRTLQEVVEKVFPWMQTKEEQDEKEFYASRGIKLKPEYVVESSRSPDEKGWGGSEAAPDGKSSQTVVPTQVGLDALL